MPTLSNSEIQEALKSLPGWTQLGNAIRRGYEFKDFVGAMAFVNKIAEKAEAANHHPDIDIRYSKVTLALTSHDSGGVTERDVKMAKLINEMK